MKARIFDGKIVELLIPVAGFSVEECFHSSILAQCVDVADDAQVDDVYVPPTPIQTSVATPTETPEEPTA